MLSKLLFAFYTAPSAFVKQATAEQWTEFLQEAREHGLLGRFYYAAKRLQLEEQIPFQVIAHGQAEAHVAAKQQHALYFELQQLEATFSALSCPCLLLKGAAYRALALPVSYGRLFSDIDLLVPASNLKQVRDKLFFAGFSEGALTDYDRHYYLAWSHQNPPLQHIERSTVIDLHHHIYPPASAKKIDISPFFEHAEPIKGSVFLVPKAAHLFIHAAVHLFYQEETHKLLKDIIDLHELLIETEQQSQLLFLLQQAKAINVESAVLNACSVLVALFNNAAAKQVLQAATAVPEPFVCNLLLNMLTGNRAQAFWAKQLWFVRGHSLKMRWQILLYHTAAKPSVLLRNFFKQG